MGKERKITFQRKSFQSEPSSVTAIKQAIPQVISSIQQDILTAAIRIFQKRDDLCIEQKYYGKNRKKICPSLIYLSPSSGVFMDDKIIHLIFCKAIKQEHSFLLLPIRA